MADQPSDVRWPPGNVIDFDDIFDVLKSLRTLHFPEHTAQDLADPYIQIMALQAAIGQHAFGRANHALLQFDLRTANARRALLAFLEPLNRPLLPIQASRGNVYGRLQSAPVVSTTLLPESMRLAQPSITDPSFSIDADVAIDTIVAFQTWTILAAGTVVVGSFPEVALAVTVGDSIVFGYPDVMFDQIELALNSVPLSAGHEISWEYKNDESGSVDSVTESAGTLVFDLSTYLNDATSSANGLEVTITYKPTGLSETVVIVTTSDPPEAVTSYLGQAIPSTSITDYEVISDWRPIPNVVDGTAALTQDGTLSFLITDVKSATNDWVRDDIYGWAIRARLTDPAVAGNLPDTLDILLPTNIAGEWYAQAAITQGYRRTISIGSADGTKFQFLAVAGAPITEPVADPPMVIKVGTDTDWSVVDDFSNTGSTSKFAIFREDPDDGWGIIFGDGTLGQLPPSGDPVTLTFRTGSIQPGDLASNVSIRALSGPGLVTDFVLYRGTAGHEVPEASDLDSTRRFRFEVVPQLALRTESAISVPEITTAMSGGGPNRATFKTADGRVPFSRAFYSLEGTSLRQYRVIVVGDESNADGTVDSNDVDEAEIWLNGEVIGVEIIGGHGPQNTEALVGSFVARPLIPTVTLTVSTTEGARAQAEQIIRTFFQPHSRDDNEAYRWDFGGKVPMAVLFGLLWEGVPNRVFVEISTFDGVTTYDAGDSVVLNAFELPTLDPTFDANVNIILQIG